MPIPDLKYLLFVFFLFPLSCSSNLTQSNKHSDCPPLSNGLFRSQEVRGIDKYVCEYIQSFINHRSQTKFYLNLSKTIKLSVKEMKEKLQTLDSSSKEIKEPLPTGNFSYVDSSLTIERTSRFSVRVSNVFQPSGWNILSVYSCNFKLMNRASSKIEDMSVELKLLETKTYAKHLTNTKETVSWQLLPIEYVTDKTNKISGWGVFQNFKKEINGKWITVNFPKNILKQ